MIPRQLYMLVVFVVLLGAITWLYVGILHSEYNMWIRIVMMVVGILGVYLLAHRDVYLPFLGEGVFPTALLDQAPNTTGNVNMRLVNLPPNSRVVYWAAFDKDGTGKKNDPITAYGKYANSGVAKSDATGTAVAVLQCPPSYDVSRMGFNKTLPKHLHYRYETSPGMLSRVYTQNIASC